MLNAVSESLAGPLSESLVRTRIHYEYLLSTVNRRLKLQHNSTSGIVETDIIQILPVFNIQIFTVLLLHSSTALL